MQAQTNNPEPNTQLLLQESKS